MPKLIFTAAEIKAYWETSRDMPMYINNRYNMDEIQLMFPHKYDALHPFYLQALRIAEDMRVHADGFYPYRLIDERRPNEPIEIKEYRCRIWMAKTKPTFGKILNSLGKIRRSADWMISYPGDPNDFTRIAAGEDLQEYCEKHLPYFTSLTDWVFDVLLRKYLIDPNALVFVKPVNQDAAVNEMLKPYPVIFDTINVLDFIEDDYAVMLNPYGAIYYEGGTQYAGRLLTIVTINSSWEYRQINSKGDFLSKEYKHNLNYLPVFQLGGTIVEQTDNQFLYESRIAGVVPEFNEAARENSDLQAAKVGHLYPERYEFTNNECKECSGNGRIPNQHWTEGCDQPDSFPCNACHGRGLVASGPLSKMILKLPDATNPGQQIPTPPAGYIPKDIEIIKVQEESVEKHIYNALSAINFEFLGVAPLAQAGVAKQYDRNEGGNTSHFVAEDIVSIMDKMYKAIAYYRYLTIYPAEDIQTMLPIIPVPQNYDLYSIADAQKGLADAKTAKINPVIINAMEKDYSNKLFSADTEVKDLLNLIFKLDPLPNITEDEKMTRLSNKGITQISYNISSNIQEFVQQALEDDKEFASKDLKVQKAVMEKMAQAVVDANASTAKVIKLQPINGQQQPPIDQANAGGIQ